MKILVFTGGLGNQIFEYAFYLHLKNISLNNASMDIMVRS